MLLVRCVRAYLYKVGLASVQVRDHVVEIVILLCLWVVCVCMWKEGRRRAAIGIVGLGCMSNYAYYPIPCVYV